MADGILSKVCSKCKKTKPVTEFGKCRASRDGLKYQCKVCVCAARMVYFYANKEAENAKSREYMREARKTDPDRIKAAFNKYCENNREKRLAQKRSYNHTNPDKMKAWGRAARDANPEKYKAHARNRKARVKRAEGSHTGADIESLKRTQRNKCACCKTSIRDVFHVDHIMPLIAGGSNNPDNLQLLCPPCNLSKGAKDPIEFIQSLGRLI